MAHQFSTLTFTDSVQAVQREMGSRPANQALTQRGPANDTFSADEKSFIAARDGFYLATVGQTAAGETGWPYLQFRGGPIGFLQVLDDRTLAYADITGNRQYISLGNVTADDRVALILMDYAGRQRLKIYAHIAVIAVDADPALAAQLAIPGYRAVPERLFKLRLETFDWNCPQHITPRFTEAEIALAVTPLRDRIGTLEAENATLRAKLAARGDE